MPTTYRVTLQFCACLLLIQPFAWARADEPQVDVMEIASGSDASFRGLSVVDSRTLWCSGTNRTVLRTTDEGKTWKNVSITAAPQVDFRDIHAFDADTAVVLSAGTPGLIFRTTDGGDSCLLYTSPSPRDQRGSRMPSSA